MAPLRKKSILRDVCTVKLEIMILIRVNSMFVSYYLVVRHLLWCLRIVIVEYASLLLFGVVYDLSVVQIADQVIKKLYSSNEQH